MCFLYSTSGNMIVWYGIPLQIFRSIDSTSVRGFPKDPKEATSKVRKGLAIDYTLFMALNICFYRLICILLVSWLVTLLEQNLVCGKNVLIDMSIHTAYVKAIRSAQHFIYIENQYFIGSSYNWSSYRDLGEHIYFSFEDFILITVACFIIALDYRKKPL